MLRPNEIARDRLVQAVAIVAIALAFRLTAVFALGNLPISRTPQLDSAAYLSWARALISDPSFWPSYRASQPAAVMTAGKHHCRRPDRLERLLTPAL